MINRLMPINGRSKIQDITKGNGLVESSNNILVTIIRKLMDNNQKSWDSKLKFSLWADRVNDKRSIGTSPIKLVYGTESIFPI